MLNKKTPTSEELRSLLERAYAEQADSTVIEKLSTILHFAEHGYSIGATCGAFGISQSTFHRWMDRFDPLNLSLLAEKTHEPLTPRKSSLSPETADLIRRYRMHYPHMGKERIAELLMQDSGTNISASSVGRIIEKECLYFADTPFHQKKRLQAKSLGRSAGAENVLNEKQDQHSMHERAERVEEKEQETRIAAAHAFELASPSKGESASISVVWSAIFRFVVIASVLTNIVFAGIIIVSAVVERNASLQRKQKSTIEYQFVEPIHTAPTDNPAS